MMAVDITTEPAFAAGQPVELFKSEFFTDGTSRKFDVTPDGQRFLMLRQEHLERETVTELRVVLNWFEELKRLVPTDN
jgi:hypothetical protein